MPEIKPALFEAVVNMIVHDLRNPAATLGANLSFTREVLDDDSVPREEVQEALADAQQALHELMRGIDQVLWLGRWSNERQPVATQIEPLRETFDRVRARVRYGEFELAAPPSDLKVRGGEALERLIELLIANGHQHAPRGRVRVSSHLDGADVVIDVVDHGRPVAPELAEAAFTLEGQMAVKGRSEGRYSRVLGLFSASVLAQSLGATLESHAHEGGNLFRVRLGARAR